MERWLKIIISIVILPILLAACTFSYGETEPLPTYDSRNAIWPSREYEWDAALEAEDVPLGKVVISPELKKAMDAYSNDTCITVGIFFSGMLDQELTEADEDLYMQYYNILKAHCATQGIDTGFVYKSRYQYCFIYAIATVEHFRRLTCDDNMALYVAAIHPHK